MTTIAVAMALLAAWLMWPVQRRREGALEPGGHAEVAGKPVATPDDSGEGPLAVAEAMGLLALALRSGTAVVTAIEVVAEQSGPVVAAHLRHVAAALRWGVEPTAAWDGLPAVWRPASQAMTLATVAGVPPAQLLHRAAEDVRDLERRRLEERAARLSVRIVIPLGLCFLPAFGLLTVIPVVAALATDLMAGAR